MSEQYSDPEVLARRLDQALPAGKTSLPPVTPDPLVNSALEIARLSVPVLYPQSSARIEARMLAAFDQIYPPVSVVRRSSRPLSSVWRWALVASLALVVLLVGLTPAVAASLPGEPLYSVKQLYENIELAAATTPAAKASVYLLHADRRTQEALALLEQNQYDPSLVTAALSNIAEAGKSETDIRASARLRGQLVQVDSLLGFVLQTAQDDRLTSPVDAAPLIQQVNQINQSDLLLALPESPSSTSSTPEVTTEPNEEVTETPVPPPTDEGNVTPTCDHGHSCESQGVPGGQVVPPTPRPTNVHQGPPSTPPGNSGGAGNGNSNGNNGHGNSSGGDNPASGGSGGGGGKGKGHGG